MLARPAAAWLLMLAGSSLHQARSASASSESEPGLDTGKLNSSTSVIHSGKQRLTVLNLNFWGLGWPWGSDKDVRIQALREELLRGNYDIVLLQELWYKEDYAIVSSAMPYATPYESINSGCTSFLLPIGCSGLAVLSKFPIVEAKLVPFTHRGNFWRFDGEIFVRKGVGVARILWHEKTIDVFTTHMVSYFTKVI